MTHNTTEPSGVRRLTLAGVFLIGTWSLPATAAPFDSALSVSASIEVGAGSIDPGTGATRAGTATITGGGIPNSGTVADTILSGLPLTTSLTDIGDGLSLDLSTTGSGLDAISALAFDFGIALSNTSTDTVFDIDFLVTYEMAVGATGDDALSEATLEVLDAASMAELITTQALFADSFSGPTSDSASGNQTFTVTLAPSTNLLIEGVGDVYGVVDFSGFGSQTDNYSSTTLANLSITAVTSRPVGVPLPASLALMVFMPLVLVFRARKGKTEIEPSRRSAG